MSSFKHSSFQTCFFYSIFLKLDVHIFHHKFLVRISILRYISTKGNPNNPDVKTNDLPTKETQPHIRRISRHNTFRNSPIPNNQLITAETDLTDHDAVEKVQSQRR